MKDNTHVVPLTESLPSDEDLSREIVNVLSGVDVFQFNIDMLMQCLSKLPLCVLLYCLIGMIVICVFGIVLASST